MNSYRSDAIYLAMAYIIMLLVMFILPFFSLENYSILKNTTSHLGAQNTPNAWIMNVVFLLLGTASIIGGWRFLGKYWFHKIALIGFGASVILTAFYQHAPIDNLLEYSAKEDEIHSLFAKTTGWFFTIFAVATAFISKNRSQQILAISIAVLAVLLSLMMFYPKTENLMGVWQRMMFILSFGWMIYTFRNYELNEIDKLEKKFSKTSKFEG
jgi:hypothetical membrane protein